MPTPTPRKRLSNLHIFWLTLIAVTGFLTALAGVALGSYAWLMWRFERPGSFETPLRVKLDKGMGLEDIATHLEKNKALDDPFLFRLAVLLKGQAHTLKAGTYDLPPNSSMREIYQRIHSGETAQYALTIPEGMTSAAILQLLQQDENLKGEITEPAEEGSLLPETYHLDIGTSRNDVIRRMKTAQKAFLEKAWAQRADNLPFSAKEDAIILASLVEKETGFEGERARVASVFINRLHRGMRLESDPTIIYGLTRGKPLGRGLRRSELRHDSLWNTYVIDGLPVSPICNPGRLALLSVLQPASTRDLYFVANGEGGHAFARTYVEHQNNVLRWRQVERRRKNQKNKTQ